MSDAETLHHAPPGVLRKIETLTALGAGELVENTLNKLIQYQLTRYLNYISQLHKDLRIHEDKYNMSSEQFYEAFESGKLGDDADFFEWSCLYENLLLYQKRISQMQSLQP